MLMVRWSEIETATRPAVQAKLLGDFRRDVKRLAALTRGLPPIEATDPPGPSDDLRDGTPACIDRSAIRWPTLRGTPMTKAQSDLIPPSPAAVVEDDWEA